MDRPVGFDDRPVGFRSCRRTQSNPDVGTCAIRSLSVLAVLVAASDLSAEQRMTIRVDERVPFSASELRRAVEPRLRGFSGLIQVSGDGGDEVRIDVGGRDRRVALSGRSGAAAARLIALVAVDLAWPDPPQVPGPAARSALVHPRRHPTDAPADRPTSPRPAAPAVGLRLLAAVATPASVSGARSIPLLWLGADARISGPWRAAVAMGYGKAEATDSASAAFFPVRLGGGWRRGPIAFDLGALWIELRGARPLATEPCRQYRSRSLGASADGRYEVPLLGRFTLAIEAGAYALGSVPEEHCAIDADLNVVVRTRTGTWLGIGLGWSSPP